MISKSVWLNWIVLNAVLWEVLIDATILRLASCNKYYANFDVIRDGHKLSSKCVDNVPISNAWHCSALCIQNQKCKSISIAKKGNRCYKHHNKNGENGAFPMRGSDWTFMETDYKVRSVRTIS